MHIGHVLHIFLPETDSQSFTKLALIQAKRGNQVTIFAPHRGRFGSEHLSKNVTVKLLPAISRSIPNITSSYSFIPNFGGFIKDSGVDILHLHSHLFMTTLQAAYEANNLAIPFLTHVHGIMAKRSILLDVVQKAYLYTLGYWLFNRSSLVICETKSDAVEVTTYRCNPSKIRIIPNAVDSIIKPLETDESRIVWCGRFVPEKGLPFLIQAMEEVVKEHPKVSLDLIGDGPHRSAIEKLVLKKRLENYVSFLGIIPHNEVMEFLMQGSIFAFPSLKEGSPRSLLEAMACGKPVVVFNIDGIKETVQDGINGRVVKCKDSHSFAGAIIDLMQNPQKRRKLGERARETIHLRYSWPIVASKLEATYKEALTNS